MAFCASLIFVSFSVDAYAQSCRNVQNTIRRIERDRSLRNLNQNTQTAQNLQRELAQLERAFVQAGCQRALNAGEQLNRECRGAAQQIIRGRSNMQTLEGLISSGRALAQQRQQLQSELASGQCGSTANSETRSPNLFEQIFGALGGNGLGSEAIFEEPQPYYQGNTVRSVCVRVSDGYYWPMSYSTVQTYLGDDLSRCQQMCPNTEVDLFYYSNPGQEPSDMVSISGAAYTSLPTAFGYRENFDVSLKCNINTTITKINVFEVNGNSRTYIQIDDLNLPMPIRDPRAQTVNAVIVAAEYVPPVQLPRKRPNFEAGETQVREAVVIVDEQNIRLLDVGGKTVRLIGPQTPYVQLAATES